MAARPMTIVALSLLLLSPLTQAYAATADAAYAQRKVYISRSGGSQAAFPVIVGAAQKSPETTPATIDDGTRAQIAPSAMRDAAVPAATKSTPKRVLRTFSGGSGSADTITVK